MASEKELTAAPSASTGGGVSFSIAKRTQSRLKEKTGGHTEPVGGRVGPNNGPEAEKDFVYSLEEGNIHRYM